MHHEFQRDLEDYNYLLWALINDIYKFVMKFWFQNLKRIIAQEGTLCANKCTQLLSRKFLHKLHRTLQKSSCRVGCSMLQLEAGYCKQQNTHPWEKWKRLLVCACSVRSWRLYLSFYVKRSWAFGSHVHEPPNPQDKLLIPKVCECYSVYFSCSPTSTNWIHTTKLVMC